MSVLRGFAMLGLLLLVLWVGRRPYEEQLDEAQVVREAEGILRAARAR